MATKPEFAEALSSEESAQLCSPPRVSQLVTSFATATTVTLKTPVAVQNNQGTAAAINVTLLDDTTSRTIQFAAYETKSMRISTVGSTGSGTTSASVLVYGV